MASERVTPAHGVEQIVDPLDTPRSFKDAAAAIGVGYHVVQRAARRGLIPTYALGTSRRYVKLRDIFAALERQPEAER